MSSLSVPQTAKRRGPRARGASPLEPTAPGEVILAPEFFARDAESVARDLLGAVLVSTIGGERVSARIVETEAYIGPEDEASHAAARIGKTRRNASLFGPPGLAYVYRIYGVHWCLNAVTGRDGHPSGVLIRAAEPIEGIEVARSRRGSRPDRDLLRGPGNLCAGLGVTGDFDKHPFDTDPLVLCAGSEIADSLVSRGPRIGVTRAKDWPLRFWVAGSPWVSGRS